MVLRAISNSLLSALMVVTLLCGGCVSCPQFFMFPGAKKDCCGAGHCERSKSDKGAPGKECKRMPLEPAAFAHVDAELPATIAPAIDLAPMVVYSTATYPVLPTEHSPPELQVLNATFLI
jgi:hypothetical protein